MKCDVALAGTALPTMHVPVVLTADPLRLARFYVHALEFELAQHIVGVFASLRSASFPLQVWGRRDARPARTRIVLEEGDAPIFDIHRHLWRVAPALLDGSSPQRTCCGAWQFRLTDIDGNQLVFMQWAGKAARAAAPRAGVD